MALRSYEARLRAGIAHEHPDSARIEEQEELFRKAWQVVLCLLWENRQEQAEQSARMTSSEPYARSEGTA